MKSTLTNDGVILIAENKIEKEALQRNEIELQKYFSNLIKEIKKRKTSSVTSDQTETDNVNKNI
ncbi:hypothetical protein B8W90_08170 [Staphylococcus hominis]|nr:hypothetical protein B8W90_08170 [Staphylococcus hominis]